MSAGADGLCPSMHGNVYSGRLLIMMQEKRTNPCDFPLFISIAGKNIRVYGGGNIALRRVKTLLSFGAAVRVIAPEAGEEILLLAGAGRIIYEKRLFSEGELSGCKEPPFLVLAATNSPEANGQIVRECRERGIPVNHGGDKSQCDFYFPAVAKEGDLVIGLTAGGSDHKLVKKAAAWIRSHLKEMMAEER